MSTCVGYVKEALNEVTTAALSISNYKKVETVLHEV